MPHLNDEPVGDDYPATSQGAILADVWASAGGWFSVANAAVYVQLQYGDKPDAPGEWTDEIKLGAGAFVVLPDNCRGVQFRNAVRGNVATVTAQIAEGSEPPLQISSIGEVTTVDPTGILVPVLVEVITEPASSAGRAFGAGKDVTSLLTFQADGEASYIFEVSCPFWSNDTANGLSALSMKFGNPGNPLVALDQGFMAAFHSAVAGYSAPVLGRGTIVQPAAGPVSVAARIWAPTIGTVTFSAGPGGAGQNNPAVATIYRVPTPAIL